ncbi:hypothetical protein H8N03_00485 [Ramlibacter sp. USB13]|uniref:DUF4148 domain-containing protein n=1 Tax=Ramlibacter cellulosilyticus TaxID=2764187 RepID=A0A923MMK2_9BURK|nr:hypothetical protein [Ramlibacter cellulosilyticus]MBC5781396.1 hypothetical protein [Ramlibacter cellulosilyticus]
MHQRTTSTLSFVGSVAAAAIAATFMIGNAHAEGPIQDIRPIAGTLSRSAVKAEVLAHRGELTSFGAEWIQQQPAMMQARSAITREQVRDAFIASRDEVRGLTAEDSGSAYLARTGMRSERTMMAGAR